MENFTFEKMGVIKLKLKPDEDWQYDFARHIPVGSTPDYKDFKKNLQGVIGEVENNLARSIMSITKMLDDDLSNIGTCDTKDLLEFCHTSLDFFKLLSNQAETLLTLVKARDNIDENLRLLFSDAIKETKEKVSHCNEPDAKEKVQALDKVLVCMNDDSEDVVRDAIDEIEEKINTDDTFEQSGGEK